MSHLGTIVIGTVTAGILSLALWDTLRDTAVPPTCAMQHPELSMIEELRAAKQAKLALLAGPAIASPGDYLAGVTLEMPLDPAIVDRLPTITRPTATAPYQVTFTEEAGIVRAVEIVVGRVDRSYAEDCRTSDDPCACDFTGDDRASCMDLELRLHAAWGAAASDDGETRVWLDPATGARARLSSCVLTFDRAS